MAMIRCNDLSYLKFIQASAIRCFSRRAAPGGFKLPRPFSPKKSSFRTFQINNNSNTGRTRVRRLRWSKRLATLVRNSKPSQTAISSSEDDDDDDDDGWIAREARTLPNIITFTRIASAPLLGYFIATEQTNYAFLGCGMAAVSDWLDGYIARKYNLTTRLGSYLDPLGDKVVINFVAVSMLWTPAAIPLPVVGLWLAKDLLLVAGTAIQYQQREKATFIQPTMVSKVNTGLQFATLAVALSHPVWDGAVGTLVPLYYMTSFTTIASIMSYRHLAFSMMDSFGFVRMERR